MGKVVRAEQGSFPPSPGRWREPASQPAGGIIRSARCRGGVILGRGKGRAGGRETERSGAPAAGRGGLAVEGSAGPGRLAPAVPCRDSGVPLAARAGAGCGLRGRPGRPAALLVLHCSLPPPLLPVRPSSSASSSGALHNGGSQPRSRLWLRLRRRVPGAPHDGQQHAGLSDKLL